MDLKIEFTLWDVPNSLTKLLPAGRPRNTSIVTIVATVAANNSHSNALLAFTVPWPQTSWHQPSEEQ